MSRRHWIEMMAAAAMLGCGSGAHQIECFAPCTIALTAVQQAGLTSAIATVTAEKPCTAFVARADEVDISALSVDLAVQTCALSETLADGTQLTATYTFAGDAGDGCCVNSTHAIAPLPVFVRR